MERFSNSTEALMNEAEIEIGILPKNKSFKFE